MFITTPGAMLPGAKRHAIETKDDSIGFPEVKTAVDALSKTFEDFRKKNDELHAQTAKDAVTKDELDKLNKGVDEAKAELQKRLDELEAKANRQALGNPGEAAAEAKAAAAFGDLTGKEGYTPEELKEYRGDLSNYLRRNEVKATTMQVANDPSGGYWVTPDVTGEMVKKVHETTPMRQLASVVTIGTDRLEGPIKNGRGSIVWVGESGARAQTDTQQLGMWAIDVHEAYAYPKVTQKLLEDAKIDVEAWIAAEAADDFAFGENEAFVTGNGVKKPRGLLSYDVADTDDATRPWGTFQFVKSGGASGFAATKPADALLNLVFELKSAYRQNAQFLMARRTMRDVRQLKDGQDNYLVDLRLRDGALVESIFGFGVAEGEDMPAVAANALPMAFGDFKKAYKIVDRTGISVVRDNITEAGFVKYHMRKRVGGGAVNFEALKFFKIAA